MCWLLGSCRRAATDMIDELKGGNVRLKKQNEEKKNGKNTWEVKREQLEMQNRLLKSKLQPQIIAEAEERRRRLLEATTVVATQLKSSVPCMVLIGMGLSGKKQTRKPSPQGQMTVRMIPCLLPSWHR